MPVRVCRQSSSCCRRFIASDRISGGAGCRANFRRRFFGRRRQAPRAAAFARAQTVRGWPGHFRPKAVSSLRSATALHDAARSPGARFRASALWSAVALYRFSPDVDWLTAGTNRFTPAANRFVGQVNRFGFEVNGSTRFPNWLPWVVNRFVRAVNRLPNFSNRLSPGVNGLTKEVNRLTFFTNGFVAGGNWFTSDVNQFTKKRN